MGSTGGGVLSRLASHAFVRELTFEAVADRECGFVDVARSSGMRAGVIPSPDGLSFSDALHERYQANQDLIFLSFYTRLFRGSFLKANLGRIFNCHPSLLPAFKGMHGFEDTLASTSTFMGCTLHAVDDGIDTGRSVIQAAIPIDRSLSVAANRHKIFLAQYYSTLQFLRWVRDGRLSLTPAKGSCVDGASFAPSIFSPNLDADFFAAIGEENQLA
ncbi:MAG: hypothetical protein HZA62_09510 [Rhodocyclales bacterium]|nr:hypothetical protein [Rhodocyclales bacterium]